MPRISEFYGIVILYYRETHSVPHIHARYGEFEAVIAMETLDVLAGRLPRLVREWAQEYSLALEDNWIRARERLPMREIPPLDYH